MANLTSLISSGGGGGSGYTDATLTASIGVQAGQTVRINSDGQVVPDLADPTQVAQGLGGPITTKHFNYGADDKSGPRVYVNAGGLALTVGISAAYSTSLQTLTITETDPSTGAHTNRNLRQIRNGYGTHTAAFSSLGIAGDIEHICLRLNWTPNTGNTAAKAFTFVLRYRVSTGAYIGHVGTNEDVGHWDATRGGHGGAFMANGNKNLIVGRTWVSGGTTAYPAIVSYDYELSDDTHVYPTTNVAEHTSTLNMVSSGVFQPSFNLNVSSQNQGFSIGLLDDDSTVIFTGFSNSTYLYHGALMVTSTGALADLGVNASSNLGGTWGYGTVLVEPGTGDIYRIYTSYTALHVMKLTRSGTATYTMTEGYIPTSDGTTPFNAYYLSDAQSSRLVPLSPGKFLLVWGSSQQDVGVASIDTTQGINWSGTNTFLPVILNNPSSSGDISPGHVNVMNGVVAVVSQESQSVLLNISALAKFSFTGTYTASSVGIATVDIAANASGVVAMQPGIVSETALPSSHWVTVGSNAYQLVTADAVVPSVAYPSISSLTESSSQYVQNWAGTIAVKYVGTQGQLYLSTSTPAEQDVLVINGSGECHGFYAGNTTNTSYASGKLRIYVDDVQVFEYTASTMRNHPFTYDSPFFFKRSVRWTFSDPNTSNVYFKIYAGITGF
jgi:hypothetical protein